MRARNIKPGFFLNCELSEVDFAARLLFIGLWCYADREGRFEWKPKQIKAAIFPHDTVNIDELLKKLLSLHFITRHENTGYVENFKRHQNPHPHEAKSRLPEKPELNQCHDTSVTLHVMSAKCNADVMIPDVMIPDVIIPDSTSIVVSDKSKRPTLQKLTDEEWLLSLKADLAFEGIDIDREISKCAAWCRGNRKQPSRRRITNWLINADKPVKGIVKQQQFKSFEQQRMEHNLQQGLEWVNEQTK